MQSKVRWSKNTAGASAALGVLIALCVGIGIVRGQSGLQTSVPLNTGKEIYQAACTACHGIDGRGTAQSVSAFQRPSSFPDFTRCDQTTPELNTDWKAVIVHGGPFRGFSQIMPSFSEALTNEQIDKVIEYMRGFCRNPHWPRGELNLARALVTEKAFPEDELVISSAQFVQGPGMGNTHIIHEQRFGVKNQVEVDVPINYANIDNQWVGGIGDTSVGVKREMFSSLRTGSILSLQGGLVLPSGNASRGFGSGTTEFETFAAFDQLFPTQTFIQFQGGAEIPFHSSLAPTSTFWYTAIGQTIGQDHLLGRWWTPMMEFLADRDLETGAKTNWDVLPEMQVTISPRQHVRADFGVRIPVSNTAGRNIQVMWYVLWDWQDGKLTEGW